MKTSIILSLIAFLCLNIYAPTVCSEKNRLSAAISKYAKDMVNRHTYEYKSSEHIKAGLFLSCLPARLSQAILQKQRANMIAFLRKNEADALEDVRKYFNVDQQEWSKIMNQTKKDIESNLNALKSTHNHNNTYHDPSLPSQWIAALKNECNRHKFNINNLNLGTTDDPTTIATSNNDYKYYKTLNTICKINTSTGIGLNLKKHQIIKQSTADPDGRTMQHSATHEMTHIVKGHSIQDDNILCDNISLIKSNPINDQLKKEFDNSLTGKKYTAAKEKTADTLVACTDPHAAKNAYYDTYTAGYFDNHNDMKTLHANWQLTQTIEKRSNLYKALKKTGQEFQNILRKYMPF